MSDKLLFSVLRRTKSGVRLRNCQTRLESDYPWEIFNKSFLREGTDYLYSLLPDSELAKLAKERNDELGKKFSELTPYFLQIRKGGASFVIYATFGKFVREMCAEFELSLADFMLLYREYYFSIFGKYPNDGGELSILDLEGQHEFDPSNVSSN
jgi:hypothetical protein